MKKSQNKIYSIVDIETTGGYRDGNKITEIAIIKFDGKEITEEFSTLINPERNIPYMITRLTGISNDMVTDAPKFYEVAKKIVELTEDTIFVAHNVFFDYNFIQREFSELGFTFKRPKLCTVRMARAALPGHRSYSLGRICRDLDIKIESRHRALGDCKATVKLFEKILKVDQTLVENFVTKESKKLALPQNLDKNSFDRLPESPGIYYFYGKDGSLLYVGKSKNIKKRVSSHFRVDVKNKRDLELKNQVVHIDFVSTGNELAALLLECHEIKTLKPVYNRQLRFKRYNLAVSLTENKSGEYEINVGRKDFSDDHQYLFSNRAKAIGLQNYFYRNIISCHKDSLEFEKKKKSLIDTIGITGYNELLEKVFYSKISKESDYTLKLEGRNKNESCLIEVVNRYPTKIIFLEQSDEVDSFKIKKDEESKQILFNYTNKKPGVNRASFEKHI